MTDGNNKRWVQLEEDDLPRKQRRRAAEALEVFIYAQNRFFSEEKKKAPSQGPPFWKCNSGMKGPGTVRRCMSIRHQWGVIHRL